MQQVAKKKRREHRHVRRVLLILTVAAIACGTGAYVWLNREVPEEEIPSAVTYGEILARDTSEVARLAVTLRSGETWAVDQTSDGVLTLEGATDWTVSDSQTASLLGASSVISYSSILTENPDEYRDDLAEFGLDQPRVVAEIRYTDGVEKTLRIGDASEMDDGAWFYMTIDGDDRLFALDKGTAEALMVEQTLLHPITQPVIHKARIDRITLRGADGDLTAAWELQGAITDSDASVKWFMTAPWQYPADGESIANLRTNLANYRLGAYVGEATAENLAQYGFQSPRFVLEVHQAAGQTAETGSDGAVQTTDWPESTFVLTVGGAKNDNVDYVRVGDSLYLSSHFTMDVFMSIDPLNTVSRYPVMTALAQLQSLTIESPDGTEEYVIRREEQVAENNELVTDTDGSVVYDTFCTRNGKEISYDAFEAAYGQLLVVTVSGRLPDGWAMTDPPHTTYTFVSTTGLKHTVALAKFDALHDAVIVDGNALFYLIDGGMTFSLEQ